MRKVSRLFTNILIGGIVAFALFFFIPTDPKNSFILGYSKSRIMMMLVFAVLLSLIIWALVQSHKGAKWLAPLEKFLEGSTSNRWLVTTCLLLCYSGILLSLAYGIIWYWLCDDYGAMFLRLSPFVLFLALTCISGLSALRVYHGYFWQRIRSGYDHFIQLCQAFKISWVLIVLFSLWLGVNFYRLASQHAQQKNRFLEFSDQKSYLVIAELAYQTDFQYKGDRNRTPLYPYLLTLVYRPSMDLEAFFTSAKQLSIYLALGMLVLIFLVSLRYLSAGQAAMLTWIAAASLFVYKSGYVQPEVMYYALSFACFVLMLKMLVRPSILTGLLIGVVSALAYYTKASILPGLIAFIVIYMAQQVAQWVKVRRHPDPSLSSGHFTRERMLPLLLVIISFLGLLFPYLQENKRIFGSYFYNVNSTFYIWYDSWQEAESGTGAHGDEFGWPDLPDEQIPSLSKYLREHSFQDVIQRFVRGFEKQWINITMPYGRTNYLLIYTLALFVFSLFNLSETVRLLRKYFYLLLFSGLFFGGYLVLFAWYSPIADYEDARFIYSLYMPYLFLVFVGLNKIVEAVKQLRLGRLTLRTTHILWVVHLIALVFLIYDWINVTPVRMSKRWYGK